MRGGVNAAEHAALETALKDFPNAKVQTRDEFIDNQISGLNDILNILYVLLALSVIVSLFGIVNTLVLTVFERTRELGMLRAIGMTRRQVRRMIRHESVITALIGGVLGIVLGIVLGALLVARVDFIEFSLPTCAAHRLRDRDDRGRHRRGDLPGAPRGEARSARSAPVRVASRRAGHALRRRPAGRAPERAGHAGASVRAELVRRLAATGLPRIEAVSFVYPSACRRWPGAEEAVAAVGESRRASGLVLNERGWERLAATPLDRVNVTLAATESFNQRNGERIRSRRRPRGSSGSSPPPTVRRRRRSASPSAARSRARSTRAWSPSWPSGSWPRVPRSSSSQTRSAWRRRGRWRGCSSGALLGVPVGGHFHHTSHTGVASAWAAVEAGAAVLDASVGGLGGRPFAPRATGNVATEDVLYLLDREGVETGVDLDALIGVARWLEELLGRELPGRVYRAGAFPTK